MHVLIKVPCILFHSRHDQKISGRQQHKLQILLFAVLLVTLVAILASKNCEQLHMMMQSVV